MTPETVIQVDLLQRGESVNERLFSQFFEHMSTATIGGLSAELLTNPTFARECRLSTEQIELMRANERSVGAWAAGNGGPMAESWVSAPLHAGFPVSLVEEPVANLPLGWAHLGQEGSANLCAGRLGDGVRLVATRARSAAELDSATIPLDGEAPGIRQGVRLPLDRCRAVDIHVVARAVSGAGVLEVALRRRTAGRSAVGEVFARELITIVAGSWQRGEAALVLPEAAQFERAELIDVCLRWHADAAGDDLVLDRVSALPADHAVGLDPEVVDLARAARIPELRWPGGNFASYYHWHDGVGPVDLRPTRINEAWGGIEQNAFGTQEYLAFCRAIGAEPHITVNSGTGSAQEAAAWVEYCNGSVDTPMGALRAAHGHPEPHNVAIWEVGNENYGTWQGGFVGSEENARRFAEFARAMRAASPIPLVLHACGNWFDLVEPRRELDMVVADRNWHTELVAQAGEHLDVLSLHALPVNDLFFDGLSEDEVHQALFSQVVSTERAFLPELAALLEPAEKQRNAPVRLSITEWGPLGPRRDRARVENAGGALWAFSFLGMLARAGSRIAMASPNGFLHGGAIKKGAGVVYTDPLIDVMARMRTLAGQTPVGVTTVGPTYDVPHPPDLGQVERDVPYVDVLATTDDQAGLTYVISSRRLTGADPLRIELPADVAGGEVGAQLWVASTPGVHATPAQPQPVLWQECAVEHTDREISVVLPALGALWIRVSAPQECGPQDHARDREVDHVG